MDSEDYISRKLSWVDNDLTLHHIEDSRLFEFDQPLVIVAQPGMGKTELMEQLGKQAGHCFVRATSFLRWDDKQLPNSTRLVIDGLDEVAAVQEGDPLHHVLTKLTRCGRPSFVLSCRAAEWRGLTAKDDILDDYSVMPLELTLVPFTREEALSVLVREVSVERASAALERLEQSGLADMYQSPLTLRFVSATLKAEGDVPNNRADLYNRAVGQLRLEHGPRHSNTKLAKLSNDKALDAAGAAMAIMLIAGKEALVSSSGVDTGGVLSVAELSDFVSTEDITALLSSNLFKHEGGQVGRFFPLHRTIAEYLGARWLARKIDRSPYPSRSVTRLLGLLTRSGGVPASLRGIHAWLPHFSPTQMSAQVIRTDPYGVLTYGDVDHLSIAQAQELLAALKKLSREDPYFSAGNWGGVSARGLMQRELYADIRQTLADPDATVQLRSLILEALRGSDLTAALKGDLQEIMLNPNRAFRERSASIDGLAKLQDAELDWSVLAKSLIALGDENSTRLAVELLTEVGVDQFEDKLIAEVVIAETRILENPLTDDERSSTVGTLFTLSREIPDIRLTGVLDALASQILVARDLKWWERSHSDERREMATFADRLILRVLENSAAKITPIQLWNWLITMDREDGYERDDRAALTKHLQENDRLRRGVQRLALFESSAADKTFSSIFHLTRLSTGLQIKPDDARDLLGHVNEYRGAGHRDLWKSLVGQFRGENGIEQDIQTLAGPYAEGDAELAAFLKAKPKKYLDDWERAQLRRDREQEKRHATARMKARENYGANIEKVKAGELGWIVHPAKAYLAMYSDLSSQDGPEGRLSEWLGSDLRNAALMGFESVLHRSDLPTVHQVAQSYAQSKSWNFIYPMLSGAGHRFLTKQGFGDLSSEVLIAIAIAAEQELIEQRDGFDGLLAAIRAELRNDENTYELYVRLCFEPHFQERSTRVSGLYAFARSSEERPLSERLSIEWLATYKQLPLEVERELVECILGARTNTDVYADIRVLVRQRLSQDMIELDRRMFWKSLEFVLDFDEAISGFSPDSGEGIHWLWPITNWFFDRYDNNREKLVASVDQLKWIVRRFRPFVPFVDRPNRATWGDQNAWNAVERIQWAIQRLAADPSEYASIALSELCHMPTDAYTNELKAALASQRRLRIDTFFVSPQLSDITAALENGVPANAADVQAIVLDEVRELQRRLLGDPLNPVNNFYYDNGKPRSENECRDQFLITLGQLPFNIQRPPETSMPQGNRADGSFTFGTIAVPLEAKGQWHKDVWNAAATQLDRLYSSDYRAASSGIYLVFWFGKTAPPGKRLKLPPNNRRKPESAAEMEEMLLELLPQHLHGNIAIVVLDLERP